MSRFGLRRVKIDDLNAQESRIDVYRLFDGRPFGDNRARTRALCRRDQAPDNEEDHAKVREKKGDGAAIEA